MEMRACKAQTTQPSTPVRPLRNGRRLLAFRRRLHPRAARSGSTLPCVRQCRAEDQERDGGFGGRGGGVVCGEVWAVTESQCALPLTEPDARELSSEPATGSANATATPAGSGGLGTCSRQIDSAPEVAPTSATVAGRTVERRLLSCGWFFEAFDMGFRVGRQISKDGVHVVLTVDADAPEDVSVPVEALAALMGTETA